MGVYRVLPGFARAVYEHGFVLGFYRVHFFFFFVGGGVSLNLKP